MLRMGVNPPDAEPVFCRPSDVLALQAAADAVYVDRGVVDYAVNLVLATRDPGELRPRRPRRAAPVRRQPPGQPRPRRRRPGPGPAAGPVATCSPRTSSTSPPTCCATASCCPTRRWPASCPPTTSWPGSSARCRRRGWRRRRTRPPSTGAGPTPTADSPGLPGAAALRRPAAGRRPTRSPPGAAVEPTGADAGVEPPAVTPTGDTSFDVLRRLELTVTRRLDGLLHGDHRGLVPGHGSEPGETRLYQPGDDVRRIDWNVTARIQAPHVRETIADRELETWLLVDLSASLEFGTARPHQARPGPRRGARPSGSSRPGAATASARSSPPGDAPGDRPSRPEAGATTCRAVLHRVQTADGGRRQRRAPTSPPPSTGSAGRRSRRGLAVVVSRLARRRPGRAPAARGSMPLRRVAVRHETLCIEVVDPRELELPDVGVLDLVDPETGRRREIQTGDRRLRARYAAAAAERRERPRPPPSAPPAPTTSSCAPTATGWSTSSPSSTTRRQRAAALARSGGPADDASDAWR